VVLGHHGHPRGSSRPVDFVCSLDHEMGPGNRDCRHRLGGYLRDARDSRRCREIYGRPKNRCPRFRPLSRVPAARVPGRPGRAIRERVRSGHRYCPESLRSCDCSRGHRSIWRLQGRSRGLSWYREYSPVQGRWISPDPTGLNAVDITNPQSWNRYAYVYNNPLSNIDPWGLACYPIYFQLAGGCSPELTEGVSFGQSWNPFTTVVIAPASGAIFDGPICWNCTYVYYAFVSAQSGDTAANNGPSSPLVMKNPCSVQGRALPPGAYVTQGQQANASTTNFLLDVSMGWPKGDYLDPQPLASGNVFQNQAYGNYVFGVYMASAGSSLNTALSGASALALGSGAYFTYTKNGYQMDPNYPLLPAANVGNITNGYNAQRNGTVCHN